MITMRTLPLQDQANRLDSPSTQLLWLTEAEKGLADIAAGRSSDARASILAIQARRSASHIQNAPRTESITAK
jgi:hypothetical protein